MTHRLISSNPAGGIVWRSNINVQEWKRALAAADLIPERKSGERYASARQHDMHALRHFHASVLLTPGRASKP